MVQISRVTTTSWLMWPPSNGLLLLGKETLCTSGCSDRRIAEAVELLLDHRVEVYGVIKCSQIVLDSIRQSNSTSHKRYDLRLNIVILEVFRKQYTRSE